MAKMIQIRHVPEELHRKLKVRAAEAGVSLSDFLRKEVELVAERPTIAELRERLARRSAVRLRVSPARVIRQERDRR
jgi:plasmid stability protein